MMMKERTLNGMKDICKFSIVESHFYVRMLLLLLVLLVSSICLLSRKKEVGKSISDTYIITRDVDCARASAFIKGISMMGVAFFNFSLFVKENYITMPSNFQKKKLEIIMENHSPVWAEVKFHYIFIIAGPAVRGEAHCSPRPGFKPGHHQGEKNR